MRDECVRLLDLGDVSYLRSQTIYHAVARVLGPDAPDTIVLLSPREPYVCIGYHQDLGQEIDLDYCHARGLPVLRREIGGGTVYLDRQQLFYHCVFHRRRVPRRVEGIYRLFLRAPIETYRRLGLDADLRGANDIVVADRKIGGTGAGAIGDAVVVCGSIMFDFDHGTMARLLRAPSEAFRSQVERQMRRHVTSLNRELGHETPRDEVRDLLIAQFSKTLGLEVRQGELTQEELADVAELDLLFLADEWLRGVSRPTGSVRLVKIRAGVLVYEALCQQDVRYARLTLSLVDGTIDDVHLVVDPVFEDRQRRGLEDALLGRRLLPGQPDELSLQFEGNDEQAIAMVQSCLSAIGKAAGEIS